MCPCHSLPSLRQELDQVGAWGKPISRWNDATWLQNQRRSFSDRWTSILEWGITRTSSMVVCGTPPVRWLDGCKAAAAVVVPLGHEGLIEDER